jgi:hypothetical protein
MSILALNTQALEGVRAAVVEPRTIRRRHTTVGAGAAGSAQRKSARRAWVSRARASRPGDDRQAGPAR